MSWIFIYALIHQVVKEQRKYDEMISDLASAVGRIVPFAERVLENGVKGDAGLLEGVIKRLYELIGDIGSFICVYAKRGRACEFGFLGCTSAID